MFGKIFSRGFLSDVQLKIGGKQSHRKFNWRPAYLQRRTLFGFLISFIGVIVALEILYHISQVNHGIASSTKSRHCAWTYGPTAIMTVIAAFWARVEFQAKQNAPWQAMQEGPTNASEGLLLDYISFMQPVALFKAFNNRQLLVAATISCSLLLRLAIIVSTGLFALQEVQVHKDHVKVPLEDTFSGKNFNFQAGNSNPFDIVNSILFKNATYPYGTTKELAFQRFSAPSIFSAAILTVPITAVAADLECESAALTVNRWQISEDGRERINRNSIDITSPSCTLANMHFELPYDEVRYEGILRSHQCQSIAGSDGMRIAVAAVDLKLTRNSSSDDYDSTVSIRRSAQLICKPTYSLIDLNATWNISEPFSTVRLERVGSNISTLPGVSGSDIASAFPEDVGDSTIQLSQWYFPFHYSDADNKTSASASLSDTIAVQLQLGAWLSEESGAVDILFKEGVLRKIVRSYYRTVAAQYINQGLTQQMASSVLGSAVVNENRVIMTEPPLRVMEVCLILGIILIFASLVQRSRKDLFTASRDPHSISGTAAILSKSGTVFQCLSGTSAASLNTLRSRLGRGSYVSRHNSEGHFIEAVDNETDETASVHDSLVAEADSQDQKKAPSKPFPSLAFRLPIFLSVVAVIVALEVLLHFSQKNDGLGDVSNSEYVHYLWTLIPSLLMVGIGLCFGSMDSNIRTLAPYAYLQRPMGATFDQCMSLNFQNSLDITVIFHSIRTRHFAVLAMTLAALATSVLTIVTSGLYSPLEFPRYATLKFVREDTFGGYYSNNNGSSSERKLAKRLGQLPSDYENIATARYILQENLTYPRWTYEELVFPKLTMSEAANNTTSKASFVDLWVPALRDAPICHLLTLSELNATVRAPDPYSDFDQYKYMVTFNVPPLSCTPDSGNRTWLVDLGGYLVLNSTGPFGDTTDAFCGNQGASGPLEGGMTGFFWGSLEENYTMSHFTGMYCLSSAEAVNTRTRFTLPNFDIPEDQPPIPDESAVTKYSSLSVPGTEMGGFFDALTSGRYAIPKENLGNASETEKVANAIKFQSNIYRAQEMNNISRISNGSLDVSYPGDVFLGTHLRLVQDPVSTRVLDGLLAFILILGVLGSILINTDHVLPKNPVSIAAVASLLADSNILAWYESAQCRSNEESQWRKVFAQHRFFIGKPMDSSEGDRRSNEKCKKTNDFTIQVAGSSDDEIVSP